MRTGALFGSIAAVLILVACTAPADDSEEPFPADWPELQAVDGVVDVLVELDDGRPLVQVQVDDRLEPADAARTAVAVRDAADELEALADGYSLYLILVHPGDYPASVSGYWDDETRSDGDFAAIVATLAAFEFTPSATDLFVRIGDGYNGTRSTSWRIQSYLVVDDALSSELNGLLAEAAAAQSLDLTGHFIDVERGFPGQ